MTVTINDVAKKAKVSIATVSRAFNNKEAISPHTRDKVLNVAGEIGYEHKKNIKKNNVMKNIGVVFDNRLDNLNTDPFYSKVMKGIEDSVLGHKFHLFFKNITGKIEKDFSAFDAFNQENKLAGMVLVGSKIDKKFVMKVKNNNIPLVLVDDDLWDENIDCIVNDNIAGAKRIVSYLINCGHKNIAFVGGPLKHISLEERYIGYKQALKENGIVKDKDLITFCSPSFNIEDGRKAVKKMLKDKNKIPTAIFVPNDMLAIGTMKGVKELGYKVPEDISVAGFDDVEMAKHIQPALSTVKVFKKEMGDLAAKRLNEIIEGDNLKPIKIVVSVEMVIRDSIKQLV